MSQQIRSLNVKGVTEFRKFVDLVRAGAVLDSPIQLLTDPATSEAVEPTMAMTLTLLTSRVELGRQLAGWLEGTEQRTISRNAGLWNWLSLRLFDQLCPPDQAGRRKVLGTPHYVLEHVFSHQRYYRHLVRFAWLAYVTHGNTAQILLSAPAKGIGDIGHWGEISEQLGARQDVLGSKPVIDAAFRLYLDEDGNPIRGSASRDRKGVVRRLSDIVNQLALTYDLRTCGVNDFLNLLPTEFERWVREYKKRTAKGAKRTMQPAAKGEPSNSQNELRT